MRTNMNTNTYTQHTNIWIKENSKIQINTHKYIHIYKKKKDYHNHRQTHTFSQNTGKKLKHLLIKKIKIYIKFEKSKLKRKSCLTEKNTIEKYLMYFFAR